MRERRDHRGQVEIQRSAVEAWASLAAGENEQALASVGMETSILDDLKVNSARLVDVVIAFEDDFDIEIADEDVDSVNLVGDAVNLIIAKL